MAIKRTRTSKRRAATRSTSRRRVAGTPWSKQELAFLRKYYRNNETSWVARQLGRSVYSVRYKASDLSIKKASPSVWKGNKGVTKPTRKATGRKATSRKAASTRKSSRRSATKRYATSKRRPARAAARRRTSRRR